MSNSSFIFNSSVELHSKLQERSLTCVDLLDAVYAQVDAQESQVKAYVSLLRETAYERARSLDLRFDAGEDLPVLAGIPIAIKDNICLKGSRTTCSSKMLEHFVSPYDATVINRLNAQGMIPVGKTNLDEFAMGSSTENSAFFTTANPWDLERVPGGSSGGSAAAVAAGEAIVALGSDTGGSIRQPAAFCGLVGMKPSYGRVSRYGLVAFASSLDQIGPFARTVEDVAHLLNALCGFDPLESTSSKQIVPDFTKSLGRDVKGLKIGIPKEMMGEFVHPDIREATVKALDLLKAQGADWEEISFDMFDYAVSTYYILAPAEASANLSRFDGVRYTHRCDDAKSLKEMYTRSRGEGFGPEVQRRIILGTYVLSSGYYDAYYLKAQKVRTLIKNGFEKLFQTYDVIVTPTTPTTAFKPGEHSENPLAMYLADIATIPANMGGLPAMSIPVGFSNGMPIGLQIMGKAFDEETVLRVGHAYQQLTDFHRQVPGGMQ